LPKRRREKELKELTDQEVATLEDIVRESFTDFDYVKAEEA
jgi:hypothetical protein